MEGEILTKTQPVLVTLDTEYAIQQAAETLDKVMIMAQDLKDPKAALKVVENWLLIAAMLDPNDDSVDETLKQRAGFVANE
jgi:hypothetical protein